MESYVSVFLLINQYLSQSHAEEMKFANAVINHVMHPLLEFYKRGEKRRKQLMQEDEKIRTIWANLYAALRKEREECMKAWSGLKAANTSSKRNEAVVARLRSKAHKLFKMYQENLQESNTKLKKLQEKEVTFLL